MHIRVVLHSDLNQATPIMRLLVVFLSLSSKCRDISNYATAASFHVLPHSLFTNHPKFDDKSELLTASLNKEINVTLLQIFQKSEPWPL